MFIETGGGSNLLYIMFLIFTERNRNQLIGLNFRQNLETTLAIRHVLTVNKKGYSCETVYLNILISLWGKEQYQHGGHFCWRATFSPKFWKGRNQEKMNACAYLKSSCHRHFPRRGLQCFLSKRLSFKCWS